MKKWRVHFSDEKMVEIEGSKMRIFPLLLDHEGWTHLEYIVDGALIWREYNHSHSREILS